MKKIMIHFLIIFSSALFIKILYAESATPRDVFDGMVKTYSNVNSYHDSGIRRVYFYNKNNELQHEEKQEFKTSYIKPDTFKFHWVDYRFMLPPKSNYINSSNGITILKKGNKEIVEYNNLNSAISRVTGTTGKVAYWLPKFILDEVFCPDPNSLGFNLIGNDQFNGKKHYKLEVTYRSGNTEIVWIDKENKTVTKIVSEFEGSKYHIVNEIIYNKITIDNVRIK